jgi:competence protein ComEC
MCSEPVGEGAKRVTTVIEEASSKKVGALTTLIARPPSLILSINPERVFAALKSEVAAQIDRVALWTPVAFGAGAAAYFGLKTEPPLWIGLASAGGAVLTAVITSRLGVSRILAIAALLIAFATCGFAVADLKSTLLASPRIPVDYGVGRIEGWVVDVTSPSKDKGRLLIAPSYISHLRRDELPALVRIVVSPDAVVGPGEAVRLTALLDPPPSPAAPGAFDFARDAWFERIGGVGLALKQPVMIDLPPAPLQIRIAQTVNRLRWRLARRLVGDVRAMGGGAGDGAAGLVAAVTTSHQDWLPADAADNLRASGLAHMLAIAGLHTAAVCGFIFAALRFGVAAWPWAALRVSGKKVAAAGALLAVLAYLTLSGAHPPAKRAAITAGVAFLAMLLDRRAISLRSLAVAALVVLLLQPEAVVQPGFQMSFSATAALVALAEIWPRRYKLIDAPWPIAVTQKAKDWIIGLAVVSFVAGAATAPFAIQHFNRIANYGVLANLTADFLASACMMPALAVTMIGEAVGLGRTLLTPGLFVSGWAARGILEIAHACATAPGATLGAPSAPPVAMLIAFLGILFACLWKGNLRWVGVPMAAAVLVWPRPPAPLAWIASDADDAAIGVKGMIVTLKPGTRAYATELWAARRGLVAPKDAAVARDALFDCDRRGCTPKPGTHPAIGAWWSKLTPPDGKLDDLCRRSQVVIIRYAFEAPATCAGRIVLHGEDFRRGGAAELYAEGPRWRIAWAQPIRGERPWSRVADEPALHFHLIRPEHAGLIAGVGGLQRDGAGLLAKALQGSLFAHH